MKSFLKRQWPLIGLGVLLLLVGVYFMKSGKKVAQESLLQASIPGEGLKLKDIHYTQDDPEKGMKWILDASEVSFADNKRSIFFRDFQLKVEPENRPPFRLKGKAGDYSRNSGEIDLRGNVEGFYGIVKYLSK